VTPVTGAVSDGEKDRLVRRARRFKRFVAPRIPIHRIVRVLKEVWRSFLGKTIGVRVRAHGLRASYRAMNVLKPLKLIRIPL
jgi:hypothetical protein